MCSMHCAVCKQAASSDQKRTHVKPTQNGNTAVLKCFLLQQLSEASSLKTTACVSKVRGQSLLNIQNIAFDLIMIFNSHTHGILLSGDFKDCSQWN